MLLNVSYNDREVTEKITEAVGGPFSWKDRLLMGGIGSPKLKITGSSVEIHNLLILDQNINACNIELRPKGLIIRFRSLLETLALIIPYYKLVIYKGKDLEYSIHKDHQFISIAADHNRVHTFMSKVLKHKHHQLPDQIDYL